MGTRHFAQVQARTQLDQVLNQRLGLIAVIKRADLEKIWGDIKDITNPERFEHWLKTMEKKICPECAEFLRKKLGISVSLDYIAIAGKEVPQSPPHTK